MLIKLKKNLVLIPVKIVSNKFMYVLKKKNDEIYELKLISTKFLNSV